MQKKILGLAITTLIIDQLFKILVEINLVLGESVKIIGNFFTLNYANNYGAAWSLFSNQLVFLILVSLVALFFIFRYINTFKANARNNLAFGLLIGGIAGNLLDRVFLGYVRDFLAFKIFNYHFPIFNISDMAIVFGVFLLMIAMIKGEDNGNSSRRKSAKN